MNLKKKMIGGLLPLSLAFSLGGCASEVENVINASENVDSFSSDIASNFNSIKELEYEVQSSFEETLANDPELESFKKEKAPLFENIDLRQKSLDAIKTDLKDLEKVQNNLSKLQNKQSDDQTVEQLISHLDHSLAALDSYTNSYQEYLDSQADYLKSLGQEEASYESFTQGIDQLAEQDQQLIEIENQLNNSLADLQESAKKAKDHAIEIQNQEEES